MGYKRDATYFKRRLRRKHPGIFANLGAGKKYESVRQAAAAAGLIKLPGRVQGLQRHWKQATQSERLAFINWIKATRIGLRALPRHSAIVDSKGYLTAKAKTFIYMWITKQAEHPVNEKVTPGQIAARLGPSYKNRDYRLSSAMKGNCILPPGFVSDLERWMRSEGFS
jgi:hypothetical protein